MCYERFCIPGLHYIPGWDHKDPNQDMLTPPVIVHKFNLMRQHAAGIVASKISKASNTQDAISFFPV